jgi:hypothetical protein
MIPTPEQANERLRIKREDEDEKALSAMIATFKERLDDRVEGEKGVTFAIYHESQRRVLPRFMKLLEEKGWTVKKRTENVYEVLPTHDSQ